MAETNQQQETTIEGLLGEARDAKRAALESQRSSDLDVARLHAMSDVMKNLFVPVAWRAGGGGTAFTSPVKSDDKGYLDAFKRAQATNASLLNLDADYRDALTNQKIKDFYRDEQRKYNEEQRDEQRKYNEEQREEQRRYNEEQEQSRREYTKELHKTQYGGSDKNQPVNIYASGGRKLSFDNRGKRDDFLLYAESLMQPVVLNKGIDDTMDDKAKAAKRAENRDKFINDNAESLYKAWANGTQWSGASALPEWMMTNGEGYSWAPDFLYGLSGGGATPAPATPVPAANNSTLNKIDSIARAYEAIMD